MIFEQTMRLFFGTKAYSIVGLVSSSKRRRQGVKRALRLVMRCVDTIETTPRHKQQLMLTVELALEMVDKDDKPSWALVYCLLALVGRLLGYDFQNGSQLHSLSYWQTSAQYYNADMFDGGNRMQSDNDEKDAISIRKNVITMLKKKGFSDFKVGLVLNTSEYEVRKLRTALL